MLKVVREPTALTDGSVYLMRPRWSPDGQWIAAAGENYKGIWLLRSDGSNLRQLTDADGAGYGFAWSPDSRSIVFRFYRFFKKRRQSALALVDIASHRVTRLTPFRKKLGLPCWLPDANHVVFSENDQLIVIELKTKGLSGELEGLESPLTLSELEHPFFYPLGRRFIFWDPRQRVQLSLVLFKAEPVSAQPSPSGKKVAFETTEGRIYVINADGSGLKDLGQGQQPRWSPSGDRLVFTVEREEAMAVVSSDLYTINIEDSVRQQLTFTLDAWERHPDWSPVGNRIVFDEAKSGRLFYMEVEIPQPYPPPR